MFRFEWIGKFLTFLYNVFMKIALFYRNGPERQHLQNRTHDEIIENYVRSDRATLNRGEGEDTVDSSDTVDVGLSGDLKNSLEKVSKAIYKKFVSDWHTPPEEFQNQPLYKEINYGIQIVFLNIKRKIHPLEEYKIIISIATAFIAHFKSKRKNNVKYSRFKTRQEEVDYVRKHIRCLLDYWLPESMQRSPLIYVFITEILSVNVLEPIINSYSEFININVAIVEALDDNRSTHQKEDSGKCDEVINGSKADEYNKIMEIDTILPRKKKKKRFTQKCKDFVKGRQRRPEFKDEPVFRSYCADIDSNALHYVGDVADVGCNDDSEEEISMTSIIDTSLQMWLQNNWTAKVSERLMENEAEYEISVYDESAPDTDLWNTKRCVKDFKLIYEKMCQKYPNSITSAKLKTTGGATTETGRQFFHSIGITPDEFINILLNMVKIHKEMDAVFFFSPFWDEEDVAEHLSDEEHSSEQYSTDDESTGESNSSEMNSDDCGLEYRTLNVQNEEDKSNKDEKSLSSCLQDTFSVGSNKKCKKDDGVLQDSCEKDIDSKDCFQADGFKFPRLRKKNKKYKSTSHSKLEDIPTRVPGREEFTIENADMRTNDFNNAYQPPIVMDSNPQKLAQKGLDLTNQNNTQTMEQKRKLQETLLHDLYELIDEVLSGGNSILPWLHSNGYLEKQSKVILDSIANICAEEQVICCLNQVAELLMSEVRPQQLPPDVLQSKALDLLKNKLQGFLTNFLIKLLSKMFHTMKNLKVSHQALQDPLANKATMYRLLEDLTKIITDEGGLK